MIQLSYPYMTTGKTIALIIQTFVGKVMSLLFNMLSRLLITFLPRSKHLLISRLQSLVPSLMANRWGNNGNSDKLYFLDSTITVDGDCSHGIKRRLLLGRKIMTNLDSILKSRDITLPT